MRTIQGLKLNEDNYVSVMKLLQHRFSRPQQIISTHMEELLKISLCVGNKLSSLWCMFDMINVNVRDLYMSSMGINSTQYGCLLIPIIMTKLTSELYFALVEKQRMRCVK